VQKGKTPYEDYSFIKHHVWKEFVEQMSSQEAKAKGEKFSKQRGTSSTTTWA
jgi:hypothetical protein